MKKVLKTAIFLMMTVGVIMGISGCGNLKSAEQQEKENEEKCQLILELLKEKYEEDFEILSYFYDGGFNALCYPVNHPEMIFDAYVPNDRISEDTYAKEILVRTFQKKCNEVLDELGIEYYCQPIVYGNGEDIFNGEFAKKEGREYIEGCYSMDLIKDTKEVEVMIQVYIPMDGEYDIEELYYAIYDLIGVMNINAGSVAYVFSTMSDLDYIKRYYDKGVLNRGGTPIDTFYRAGVGITGINNINTELDGFREKFKEYQKRAQEEKK